MNQQHNRKEDAMSSKTTTKLGGGRYRETVRYSDGSVSFFPMIRCWRRLCAAFVAFLAMVAAAGAATAALPALNWSGSPTVSPTAVAAGGTIVVAGTLGNSGKGAAVATQSKAQVKNSAGIQVATATIATPALAANTSTAISISVPMPASLPAGTYQAYLIADNLSVLQQAAGANNFSSGASFSIAAALPALNWSGLPSVSPASVAVGGTVAVNGVLRNSGGGAAVATQSKAQVKNSAGVQVATATVATPALAANASTQVTISVPIPASLPAGTYQAFLIADNLSVLQQASNANNFSSGASFSVTAAAPSSPAPTTTPTASTGSTTTTGFTTIVLGPTTGSAYYTGSVYPGSASGDRIRCGGWGDTYAGFLAFNLPSVRISKPVQSAKLRIYVLPDDPRSTPTAVRVARVTAPWPTGTAQLQWGARPASVDIAVIPAPTLNSWVEVDLSTVLNQWITGACPNYGLAFIPQSTNNNYSTFAGPDYSDPSLRPQIVVQNAAPAIGTVTITSKSFVLQAGSSITLQGQVTDSQGNPVVGASVTCSDGLRQMSRAVATTDSAGKFSDVISLSTATNQTGNYTLAYAAGGLPTNVIFVAVNPQAGQIVLPGVPFDFTPGVLLAPTADAQTFTRSFAVAGSTPALSTNTATSDAARLLNAVTAASADELRSLAGDPSTYVLIVSSVACMVPAIEAVAAPACAVVFDRDIDVAEVAAFTVGAKTALNLSPLGASDKAAVGSIIDGVMSVRAAVSLTYTKGLTNFDLGSQAWSSGVTVWNITHNTGGAITGVDATIQGPSCLSIVRWTPVTPYVPSTSSSSSSVGTSAGGTTTTTSTTTTGTSSAGPSNTSSANQAGLLASAAFSGASTAVVNGSGLDFDVTAYVTAQTPIRSGFCVGGATGTTRKILFRGVGPSLVGLGLTGPFLANPSLSVFDSNGNLIATNDDWGSKSDLITEFDASGLFPLVNGSSDAALSLTLTPGVYTVQVTTSQTTDSGLCLLEVLQMQ